MISQKTIEEVKARASITDVIGETVQLKRQGSSIVGLCPFHNERSPSFHIRDDQYFHCFGCGKSGNVVTFVMETKGLSFPEAIEDLAARFGIEVEKTGGPVKKSSTKDLNALYSVNAKALEYFRLQLQQRDPKVVAYAKERRLNKDAFQSFAIGFAPYGNGLLAFLQREKVPESLLVQSGLVRRNTKGDLYDSLRGRLVFPIFIDNKRVAGFGGRVIPSMLEKDSTAPKYLNSPETPVYHKSKVLFGLPQAMNAIREEALVYVVEGYMDVIGLWQVGVRNVVATCGTALTEEHVKKLSRITKRVVLLFDADTAGKAASAKSFRTFLNSPVDVWAVYLDDGEDPDSIAAKYGDQTAMYLHDLPKISLFDAYFDSQLQELGVSSVDEIGPAIRGKLASSLGEILAHVKDPIARTELSKHAAQRLRIAFEQFDSLVSDKANITEKTKSTAVPAIEKEQIEQVPISKFEDLPKLDQAAVTLVMGRKEEFVMRVLKHPVLSQGLHQTAREFIEALNYILSRDANEDEKKEQVRELLKAYGSSWTEVWKRAHQMFSDKSVDPNRQFEDLVLRARQDDLKRAIARAELDVSSAQDRAQKDSLLQYVVDLRKQLHQLSAPTERGL